MTDKQGLSQEIDLTPFVRLTVDELTKEQYELEIVFLPGTHCVSHTSVNDESLKAGQLVDYIIECRLEPAGEFARDIVITIPLTRSVNETNNGRILVMGAAVRDSSGGDGDGSGPKGDPKTIIRFEDAVVR